MKQLNRLPRDERSAAAYEWKGKHVRVTTNWSPETHWHEMTGTVVTIAALGPGVQSDQLVLQEDHPEPGRRWKYPVSISLATVVSVEDA